MNEDEALDRLARLAAEIADRVDVFGFEYESGNVALVVFKANEALVESLMRDVDPDETKGASLWRTKDAATESRWFVVSVDDGLGLRERGTWGAGAPNEIVGRERAALVERHLERMLTTFPRGGSHRAHYGLGAELHRGGDLRLRIGRDE